MGERGERECDRGVRGRERESGWGRRESEGEKERERSALDTRKSIVVFSSAAVGFALFS